MKDALGHGSDGVGLHAQPIHRLPRGLGVAKTDFKAARTAAGQVDKRVGQVWQKVTGGKRRAVAERVAQLQRIDNPNSIVRVK